MLEFIIGVACFIFIAGALATGLGTLIGIVSLFTHKVK